MFCPECRAEFREGFASCSDCGVPLVKELPPDVEVEHEDFELEKVFESANPALVAIAKAVLEGAGIDYITSGEDTQYQTLIPVWIRVRAERAAEAKSLLQTLLDSEVPPPEDETADEQG
jgi:hypothetical protein